MGTAILGNVLPGGAGTPLRLASLGLIVAAIVGLKLATAACAVLQGGRLAVRYAGGSTEIRWITRRPS